jgi:trimethylamine--corrinoid protein Co-methyltransferase
LDFQAGYEKMLTLLTPILAGIDLLFYPGTLEHAETVSLESLVLDHDLSAIALRMQEGLRTSDDLLSVDLIRQVGPGGTFLSLPQTAREMFREMLVHGLWDRRRREDWQADGAPGPPDVAAEKVREILSRPREPLTGNVETKLSEAAGEIASRHGATELMAKLWNH